MDTTSNSVLVVGDDPGMVRLLTKWLEGAGFQVRTAENGRQAVQLMREQLPHYLLANCEMPYMNGLELCRWLREQTLPRYVYTVLITGRSGEEDVVPGLSAGADSFVRKPVDRDELVMRLRSGTRMLELEQRLRNLARVESLTGLFTRNTFLDLIEKEWSRASRYHLPMSCAILDVDHGQRISEQFGRQVAEEVIRQVARTLASASRKCDVIAHDGADAFLILLPETGEPQAAAWAERISAALRQIEIPVESAPPLRITASGGIAERLHDTPSATQLLRMADEALLVAKRSGRDRVVTHRSIGLRPLAELAASDPAAAITAVPAQDAMTPLATCFRHDETVDRAARFFLRFRTNSVPVVDGEGKLVGILSEKDVMAIMLQADWQRRRIADVMQPHVVSYPVTAPVSEIYDFLCRVTIRGVVVVNEGQQPVGMINRGSLLRFFISLLPRQPSTTGPAATEETAALAEPRKIARAVRALVQETADLQKRFASEPGDVAGCVLGSMSRIQELTNNILAWSQPAMPTGSTAATWTADRSRGVDEASAEPIGV
ncbi:MAG TPA: diguanylate cyclase [Pirellulaceae bacterium]|nr:diguanylate cyclase [Pirellulaceae bacterium]